MQQFLAHGQVALQHRMHRILGSVMQALEGAGRTVCDCTDAVPWECTMDLARQVWDKARHVDIFMQLLAHVEGSIGEGPESTMLSRCAYLQAPEEPAAGINRGLEGLACDELVQLIELAQNIGDLVMERALDFVLADEMTHMRMRSTWLREQPAEAPGAYARRWSCSRVCWRWMPVYKGPERASPMPLYDRRTMEGVYSVEQTALLIRHYRYAEEHMMRIMAGWIALTPELVVKLEFGRQVWDCAQHADILGKRLPELRSRAQVSEPPNAAFVTFMTMLAGREQPEETIERLVGLFRVLKPHLLSVYAQHLSACNPIYEPPTIRILERLVHETQEHILKGQILLEDMACTVPTRERAVLWQLELEKLLVAAGGVWGRVEAVA